MGDAWTEHGFAPGKGNPVGLENSRAANGLLKALVERENACLEDDEDAIALDDVETWRLTRNIRIGDEEKLLHAPPARPFARFLDARIASVCRSYLNHRAYEKDKTDIRKWTFNSLCETVSELNGGERIIDSGDDLLVPNNSWLFARQRYQMINLLKTIIYKDGADCEVYKGDVHNGIPSSPDAADGAAKGEARKGESKFTRISEHREDIYGPTHGWREGSYCCNNSYVTRMQVKKRGVLCLDVSPFYEFDDFGTGLHVGMNLLDLDENGEINWPLSCKTPSFAHAFPVKNVNVTYGWSGAILVMKDAWKEFAFYHDIG